MEEFDFNAEATEQDASFSLSDFFKACAKKWRWFAISVFCFLALGTLYYLRQQPQYARTMAVLIKDQQNSQVSNLSSAFSSMGLGNSNPNVKNELISLTSPAVMMQVVKDLDLQTNYASKGLFHANTLYGSNLPFLVKFPGLDEQEGAGFRIKMLPNGDMLLRKFVKYTYEGKKKFNQEIRVAKGASTVKTPIGEIVFMPNPAYIPPTGKEKKEEKIKEMYISHMGLQSTVERYSDKLSGRMTDKQADVIDLSIKDVSTERAVDVLNCVLKVYTHEWVYDKNKVARATDDFINERLDLISAELNDVDSDISKFKSQHLTPDLRASASLTLARDEEMKKGMLEVNNMLAMTNFLREYIDDPKNAHSVIPVNTGIESNQLEAQIANYNTMLVTRNALLANSSETNPLVKDYDIQLASLRSAIESGIETHARSLKGMIRNILSEKGTAEKELSEGPEQAQYLISVERQQKVKESLYLFLLQKREENELSQKFTVDNTRLISPPNGSLKPVSPKKMMILMGALLLGICFPGVMIYVMEANNTKIRSRKDLDRLTAPFAGEIPYVGTKYRFSFKKKKASKKLEQVNMVVKEGSRDMASEAFRIVRGNLNFMMQHERSSNVIILTSFNTGSGKSFISFNLAASFALKGKRVLVIDGDLRHASASQFVNMPSKGVSSYLTGSLSDWATAVVPVKDHPGMFVLPVGHIPPNPSELLDNGAIGQLIQEAKTEYDYIFIDCPPVNVVVDTQIIGEYADRTIFVVRAGLLDRADVKDIENLYKEKKFKHISIVLNAVEPDYGSKQRYGSYGYYGSTK